MVSDNQDGQEADNNPYQPPPEEPQSKVPAQLSLPLALILFFVIVASFFLSIPFGVGVFALAIPAYARAASRSRKLLAAGRQLSTLDRVLGFLGSVAVVFGCLIAGCAAFFVTCTGSLFFSAPIEKVAGGEGAMWVLVGLSCLGFLLGAGLIYRVCWPSPVRSGKASGASWETELESLEDKRADEEQT